MQSSTTNGANGATRLINGRGLPHRQLTKRQRAALAADVLAGRAVIQLSAQQLAGLLGVSLPYIARAGRLSPEIRTALINGEVALSFSVLAPPKHPALAAPEVVLSDTELADVIAAVGVDRTLRAAIAVENGRMHS